MAVKKFYNLAKKDFFPLCRSITGKGTLKTLKIIKKNFNSLKLKSIKSGKKVFDWTIPSQWEIKTAYLTDKFGKRIIDFRDNNLHLVGYSNPIKKKITLKQLLKHLHSLPEQPNAIPYVTAYYKNYWGFCVYGSHQQ